MRYFLKGILSILSLTLLISVAYSGTTGKIAGTVIDKTTREPLIGANIIVAGTSLGATTDIDGHYTILLIPPGVYTIQVSFVGYNKQTIANVRVIVDQTARVNVELEPSPIEIGETVVIAERNLVKPEVATSVVALSSNEINVLPVSNVTAVLGMQAGIRNNQIRGSGLDQALFLLDGAVMRDPRNNQAITSVALSSIEEINIERSGFNAEYGQVQSGIINVVTKEGSKKIYGGNVNLRITPPQPKYYRGNGIPDIHDPNSYWLRPFYDPAVCWTGTENGEWDYYTRQEYMSFQGWNAVSKSLCTDNDPNNDLTPAGAQRVFMYETRKRQFLNKPDYDIDAGFGGPFPYISEKLGNLRFFASYRRHREMLLFPTSRPDYTDYDWRVVLTSDVSKSMKLSVSGTAGNVETMAENWNYGMYPRWPSDLAAGTGGYELVNLFSDMAYSITDISHAAVSAKLTHILSQKTYYEVSLEQLRRKYFTRPPAPRDLSKKYEVIPGFFETSNPLGYYSGISDGIILNQSDQQCLARDNSIVSSTILKADITSQVDFRNQIKAGIEFNYNDLDLDYGFIQMQSAGEKYNYRILMHTYPIKGSGYIQDKLEAEEFTLIAGVRLDYTDSRTVWWDYDPFDSRFYSFRYDETRPFPKKKSKPQWQISPRLGISHPITEDVKLYFNYGHFKQVPQYETLFRVARRADKSLYQIGDPNLTLAKTIAYELGFDLQLFENSILIQLALYYKDISNQQSTVTYYPIGASPYQLTTSDNYSDIRGLELTIRKPTGQWVTGFLNFTYQATSTGHFGLSEVYEDKDRQIKEYLWQPSKYYVNRYYPAPYGRLNINLFTPEEFGPKFLKHHFLGGIVVNLLMDWQQGGKTTYNPKSAKGVYNNIQYVDYFDASLRASKTIKFKYFAVQLYTDVSNLFNILRLRNTYDPNYRRSLHLPKSEAYDNIPGNDKFGDYRKPGVEWQPMEYRYQIQRSDGTFTTPPENYRAIYYEGTTGRYWHVIKDPDTGVRTWQLVDQKTIDRINKDKAYIYNPGPSTFWFLNPRTITYGINISFNFEN